MIVGTKKERHHQLYPGVFKKGVGSVLGLEGITLVLTSVGGVYGTKDINLRPSPNLNPTRDATGDGR